MNSKSLHFVNHADSNLEIPALPTAGFLTTLLNRLGALVSSTKSPKIGRTQPARDLRNDGNQDILRSLPIEEKMRLGMYHFMD